MPFLVTSRRPRRAHPSCVAYPAGQMWLVGRPQVGGRMALMTRDGERSVLTSTIQRVFEGDDAAVYVETRGSVYQLQPGEP